MHGMPTPDSYKAMCRECGDIVAHRLDKGKAVPCTRGHLVTPTIPRASLNIQTQPGGSTSQTYKPPRQYTRREVNAHNAKYIARKKKQRKPSEPKDPASDHDPFPNALGADGSI